MKPTSPDPVKQKLENRLRFYGDLGIRTFYRDREGDLAVTRAAAPRLEEVAVGPLGPASAQTVPHSPEEDILAPKKKTQLDAAPVSPSAAPAVAASAAKLEIMGNSPTLFQAADRIEGDTLESISADIGECTRCKLHRKRNKIVFGVGNPHAELVFVGEGPGHDEDLQGIPFVGRAGKLLTQMIEAMGLRRDDVYIANVVKCRPPENRTPEKDEVATCMPFLFRQLGAIEPKAIVCLGNCAAQALLGTNKSISHFRGQWFDYRGSKLLATYHPAYLLRNPNAKPEVWADLKKVMAYLGLKPPPPRSKS
jgi:uracil-DNA glycosylase family 4